MQWLDPWRDHTRRTSWYLTILGIVSLMGCNLGGLLWLWFADRVNGYDNRFRIATIVLCGIHVASALFGLAWAGAKGVQGTVVVATPGFRLDYPPLWLVGLLMATIIAVYGLPIWWLTRPGTRAAWAMQKDGRALCRRCLYNLRDNTTGRCPECGEAITIR